MFKDWGGCVDPNGVATLRCVPIVFGNLISAALIFAGSVAGFFLLWGSIKMVMSGGDPKQLGEARQIITYALIGVVLVLLSFAIIFFISYITKVDCITQLDFEACGK